MDELFYRDNRNFQSGTSFPEQFVYRCLNQLYEAENRRKESGTGVEYDIAIEELNLRIEYSGEYWHKDKAVRDQARRDYCRLKNISYIEIIEQTKGNASKVYVKDLYMRITIGLNQDFTERVSKLKKVVAFILKRYGHSIKEIDTERAIYEALMVTKRYDYKILYKNGVIIGTEYKTYSNNFNLYNCGVYGLEITEDEEFELEEFVEDIAKVEEIDMEERIKELRKQGYNVEWVVPGIYLRIGRPGEIGNTIRVKTMDKEETNAHFRRIKKNGV